MPGPGTHAGVMGRNEWPRLWRECAAGHEPVVWRHEGGDYCWLCAGQGELSDGPGLLNPMTVDRFTRDWISTENEPRG